MSMSVRWREMTAMKMLNVPMGLGHFYVLVTWATVGLAQEEIAVCLVYKVVIINALVTWGCNSYSD